MTFSAGVPYELNNANGVAVASYNAASLADQQVLYNRGQKFESGGTVLLVAHNRGLSFKFLRKFIERQDEKRRFAVQRNYY